MTFCPLVERKHIITTAAYGKVLEVYHTAKIYE